VLQAAASSPVAAIITWAMRPGSWPSCSIVWTRSLNRSASP
jgi:hypothetical protein